MEPLAKAFIIFIVGVAFVIFAAGAISDHQRRIPREQPAYCIDPFASRALDADFTVYMPCTLVPMWSIKV